MNTKLVIMPEVGQDLFTLATRYGISKGPVNTPIRLEIELIRAVLSQYNNPIVQEVLVDEERSYRENGQPVFVYTRPVTLTLDNLTKKYEEILGEEVVPAKPLVEVKKEEPKKVEEKKAEPVEEKVEEAVAEEVEEAVEPEKEEKKPQPKKKK